MYGISMCAGLFLRYYSYVWCKKATVLHQREDASSIPTTASWINNLPPLNTSESPCLQMLWIPARIYPPGPALSTLIHSYNHTTTA